MNVDIPAPFARQIRATFRAEGEAWLARLPSLVAACQARWGLALEPPVANLSYNWVAPATLPDGTSAMLKLGVPESEYLGEIDALRHYDGHGIARLLAGDRDLGAQLLERLEPGTMLATLVPEEDERATRIAAGVMRAIWRPLPAGHTFRSIADWHEGFARHRAAHGDGGPIPHDLLDRAEALWAELTATTAPPVLLHGDLHHDNILRATRAPWLAIDPKGIAGEPAYEIGAFLRNPLPIWQHPKLRALLDRRLTVLAEELAIPRARLLGWGVYVNVLSAIWSAEDEGQAGVSETLHVVRTLDSLW